MNKYVKIELMKNEKWKIKLIKTLFIKITHMSHYDIFIMYLSITLLKLTTINCTMFKHIDTEWI